jgi:glucose-6-phosphate dehydrogenase assembly protein OpcA
MAETSSDAFLSGHGVPIELHDIETELARLWGPAAERAGGPDLEKPHVTRIVLANLVVEGRSAESARLGGVLDTVMARYPCRTIVLCRSEASGRSIAAEVSALCHLPAPGLPQVCSERIVLRASSQAVDLVAGAVRPLLEPDLPFVLWWTNDPRAEEPLFRDLGDECSRLLLDLPDPGAEAAALRLGLDPAICPYSRDTAWFGLTRWRELIAQFFDPPCHLEPLARIDSVRIDAVSPRAGSIPRLAVWLAAWLAGQLGWEQRDRPERSAGRLKAGFRGPSGPIAVEIVAESAPGLFTAQLNGTTLTTRGPDGAETFQLRRKSPTSPEIEIKVDSPDYCTLPRVVLAPELDALHRISAALESSRHDPSFRNALPHALWLLDG